MRKFLKSLPVFFLAVPCWAGLFGSGGSPDYSNNASQEFYCADVAGVPVTTQAGLSVTAPALVLTNPARSQKLLTLLDVGINITASPAAAAGFFLAFSTGVAPAIAYATNTVVTPAYLTTVNASTGTQLGLSSGQCYGGVGTTLNSTPIAFRYLGGTTGASGIGGVVMTDMTQGKVVLPPGATISIQAKTAAAISAHFLWREDSL